MAAVLCGALALSGCLGGKAGSPSQADKGFLAEVQGAQPSVSAVRTNTQLIRLGHAVCSDLSSGASYEETADRLSLDFGAGSLPSQDLGAVIQAAADNYCPKFRSKI